MPRLDFTQKDKTGQIKNVGYLNMETSEEKCTLNFYGDIVSEKWITKYYEEDQCPQNISEFLADIGKYQELEIHFNSAGGSVFAGLAIYNLIKRHQGKKIGYVDGMAASIASVIMFACDELHFATGAQAMIHKPWTCAYGNATELQKVIEQLDKCEESILDVYMLNVKDGVEEEEIKNMMEEETWLSGKDMEKYFNVIVDDGVEAVACASEYFDKYKKAPIKKENEAEDIADKVLEVLEKRNKEKKEKEIENLLADIDDFGI